MAKDASNRNSRSVVEREQIIDCLKNGLSGSTLAAMWGDEPDWGAKLRIAHEIARELLVTHGWDPKDVHAWLVTPGGGTWKRRVSTFATQQYYQPHEVIESLVALRRRQLAPIYSVNGQEFGSARELYDTLVGDGLGSGGRPNLCYGRFVQRLATSCGALEANGITRVDIDSVLARWPNTGSRDAKIGPIRVVGPEEEVSMLANAARTHEWLVAAFAQEPEKLVSRRRFNARVQQLRTIKQLRPSETLTITMEDAEPLVTIDRGRLNDDELTQRLTDYETEHQVTLAIPVEEACHIYQSNQTKFPFRCPTHPGKTFAKSVAKFHQGCPDCGTEAGIASRRLREKDLRQFIEVVVGVKLVTPYADYRNNRMPLKLKSPDGAIYWRSIDGLRRNPFLVPKSASELCLRLVLETVTGKDFISCSPAFAKGLILDNYCEELSLIVENDGKQHFALVAKYHSGEEDLRAQLSRDATLDEIGGEADMRVLHAPYTLFPFANPDIPKSERVFDAEKVIVNVYEWLWEKNIGVTLRPLSEVVEVLAHILTSSINGFRAAKWRAIVKERNGEFLSRDPGTGRIEYRCCYCNDVHVQGSNNMASGYVARDCENAVAVKMYMAKIRAKRN